MAVHGRRRSRTRAQPIYVEIEIACVPDELWRRTQEPGLHERWDVRFSRIEYLPRDGEDAPQRFVYRRRVLPGLTVTGDGETKGSREGPDGSGASALRFGSPQRRSLIRTGSGYWRYIREGDQMRFLTRYDYEPRWGALGRVVDRMLFRPALGWGTAWSFDRLRLWLEDGQPPQRSLQLALAHGCAIGALTASWAWQGVVPKLLVRDSGELELLRRSSAVPAGRERLVLTFAGLAEIGIGAATAHPATRRPALLAHFAVLPALAAGALRSDRSIFVRPFNPVSLTVAMLGLAAAALLTQAGRPSASRCRRSPSREARTP